MAGHASVRTGLELAWTAGFLEGEGSFTADKCIPAVVAVQVQREPLERLERMFGGRIRLRRPAQATWKPCHAWRLRGSAAAGLMMTMYGMLSQRRRQQVSTALAAWRSLGTACRYRTTCRRCGLPLTSRKPYGRHPKNARWCRPCAIHSSTLAQAARRAAARANRALP